MKKALYFLLFTTSFLSAQVVISDDTTYLTSSSLTPKAIFDVNSKKAGILLPKVSLIALAPSNTADWPPEGTIVYNTNTSFTLGYYVFIDGKWSSLLNTSTVDNYVPTIQTYSATTFNSTTNGGNSINLTSANNIPGAADNIFFPTTNTNDGGFAKDSDLGSTTTSGYRWQKIPNYEVTGIVIPDPSKIDNKISANATGTITFSFINNGFAPTGFTYAVALFKERTDVASTPKLVGTKIFSVYTGGTCPFESFNTLFYDENLAAGTYKYYIAYKYLYTGNTNVSITFGDQGSGCSNHSSFSTQQSLIVSLNKIPKP